MLLLTTLFFASLAAGESENCECPNEISVDKDLWTCEPYNLTQSLGFAPREEYELVGRHSSMQEVCGEQVRCDHGPGYWCYYVEYKNGRVASKRGRMPFRKVTVDIECESCWDFCTNGLDNAGICNADLECITDRNEIRKIDCEKKPDCSECGPGCCGVPCEGEDFYWEGRKLLWKKADGFCDVDYDQKYYYDCDTHRSFNHMRCLPDTDCSKEECGAQCFSFLLDPDWGTTGKCDPLNNKCEFEKDVICPTEEPTSTPTTLEPTLLPGHTHSPTIQPSLTPSLSPTSKPTLSPTTIPSLSPSDSPTVFTPPSLSPTFSPTTLPPTNEPTRMPTGACTAKERRNCDQKICNWKRNECSPKPSLCWQWGWGELCKKNAKKLKVDCFWDDQLKSCLSGRPEDQPTKEDEPIDKPGDGPLNYAQFKDWCIDNAKEDECKELQCGPWKNGLKYCIPTKKKSIKCAKFKSQDICVLVGCTFKSGKCKGQPFKK